MIARLIVAMTASRPPNTRACCRRRFLFGVSSGPAVLALIETLPMRGR